MLNHVSSQVFYGTCRLKTIWKQEKSACPMIWTIGIDLYLREFKFNRFTITDSKHSNTTLTRSMHVTGSVKYFKSASSDRNTRIWLAWTYKWSDGRNVAEMSATVAMYGEFPQADYNLFKLTIYLKTLDAEETELIEQIWLSPQQQTRFFKEIL